MHIDADRHFRKLRQHPPNAGKNLQGTAIATYPMIKMPDDVSLPQENANSPFYSDLQPAAGPMINFRELSGCGATVNLPPGFE